MHEIEEGEWIPDGDHRVDDSSESVSEEGLYNFDITLTLRLSWHLSKCFGLYIYVDVSQIHSWRCFNIYFSTFPFSYHVSQSGHLL